MRPLSGDVLGRLLQEPVVKPLRKVAKASASADLDGAETTRARFAEDGALGHLRVLGSL
jgi:hypothetical protein